MNNWIYSLVLVVTTIDFSYQGFRDQCQLFPASFPMFVDQIIDGAEVFLDDPDLKYLREVMKLRDDAVQHTIDDAMKFFNESYGLHFSPSPPNDQNEYFYWNAKLSAYRVAENIEYLLTLNSWILTGNSRSTCYLVHEGGFRVSFSGDQSLNGSYGGAAGKPAGVGNFLVYGFYIIDVCGQSPVIIQYQSATPIRQEPVDGIIIINLDLYSRVLGKGKAEGIYTFTPAPDDVGKFHLIVRNFVTFSGE